MVTSRSAMKTTSKTKFVVEKYDDTNNFDMWYSEVMDVLFQQELDITLEKKPEEILEKE